MRKRNKENIGLPSRWRFYHGAYYYQVPKGQEDLWDRKKQFRLGSSLSEAYQSYAQRISWKDDLKSMFSLLDRYIIEIVPRKAPSTQRSNKISLKRLRGFFGDNPVQAIRPKHIYSYRDICNQRHGETSSNRDLEVLSHAFTKAIEWGVIDDHPMAGKRVTKNPVTPRNRYIEDWELREFLSIASPFIKSYVDLKLTLGLRKGDMLSLRLSDITKEGIYVRLRKTATTSHKQLIYQWSKALRKCIQNAIAARSRADSEYLFCTRAGEAYIKGDGSTSGFDSIWQRAMRKALSKTKLRQRFTEHDLRAKVASDTTVDHARELMGHSNQEITNRIYRRKPDQVRPAK